MDNFYLIVVAPHSKWVVAVSDVGCVVLANIEEMLEAILGGSRGGVLVYCCAQWRRLRDSGCLGAPHCLVSGRG